MPPPRHRKRRLWSILLGVVAVLGIAVYLGIDPLAEHALRKVAASAEDSGYRVGFSRVRVRVLEGSLRVEGLTVSPTDALLANDTAARFEVAADVVDMRGVDLPSLVFRRILKVGRIGMHRPVVTHSHVTRNRPMEDTSGESPALPDGLALVRIDTLAVVEGHARSSDRERKGSDMEVERLDLTMLRLVVTRNGQGGLHVAQDRTWLTMRDVRAGIEPFYTLTIDALELVLPADSLRVTGLSCIPGPGPKGYHRHVKHQVELYNARVDTLLVSGFDLPGNLNEGAIRARGMAVSGMALTIHRDKSIPMEPGIRKPLPAEAIHALALPVKVDTIILRRGTVRYCERIHREDDYGVLSFTGIGARLTGLGNMPSPTPPDLHLSGTARISNRGHARLDMRMAMRPEGTALTVHAQVRDLPFEVLNHMSDHLVQVTATDGRVHHVEMRMRGDDRTASGTLEAQYEDLRIGLGQGAWHAKPVSMLANALVHGRNMPDDKRYRKATFKVVRQQDKGVFNYLWMGMREGLLEVILPPRTLEYIRKRQGPTGFQPAGPWRRAGSLPDLDLHSFTTRSTKRAPSANSTRTK